MPIQLSKLSAVWRCWWTLRVTIYSILLPLTFYFFFEFPDSPFLFLNVKFWSWQLCATYEMDGVISDHMNRCAFKMVRHVVAFRECPRSRFILTYLVWGRMRKQIALRTKCFYFTSSWKKFKTSSNRSFLSKLLFFNSELRGSRCLLTIAKQKIDINFLPYLW
jgi:hypothetical protein